jgi:hypothetical protein
MDGREDESSSSLLQKLRSRNVQLLGIYLLQILGLHRSIERRSMTLRSGVHGPLLSLRLRMTPGSGHIPCSTGSTLHATSARNAQELSKNHNVNSRSIRRL